MTWDVFSNSGFRALALGGNASLTALEPFASRWLRILYLPTKLQLCSFWGCSIAKSACTFIALSFLLKQTLKKTWKNSQKGMVKHIHLVQKNGQCKCKCPKIIQTSKSIIKSQPKGHSTASAAFGSSPQTEDVFASSASAQRSVKVSSRNWASGSYQQKCRSMRIYAFKSFNKWKIPVLYSHIFPTYDCLIFDVICMSLARHGKTAGRHGRNKANIQCIQPSSCSAEHVHDPMSWTVSIPNIAVSLFMFESAKFLVAKQFLNNLKLPFQSIFTKHNTLVWWRAFWLAQRHQQLGQVSKAPSAARNWTLSGCMA